ncbi:MAG TPA: UDP-N-acetylglucosamine 1-carboxyvinyltransferase [Candidatus Parcubacteria bacterium]|nr:UDP-N-acetylglucosamine 1-carboxyvinyltransferase [Candidatus Parcubacteria bacterium]
MKKKEKFVIRGGVPLKGEVEVRGAKNATFPILAAALLTDETCVVDNVPLIEDVFKMLRILEEMGVKVSWLGKRKLSINSANIDPAKIPSKIVTLFRGSILLLGPLLARFEEVKIPTPGGCIIGARPLDTHLDAFSQLGFKYYSYPKIKSYKGKSKFYCFKKEKKDFGQEFRTISTLEKNNKSLSEVVLREFSVTATENVLLFAALSGKKIVLKIADLDYQVRELVRVLRKMGVKINEAGLHSLEIIGKKKLKGFQHSIISDPIETSTFMMMSLATKGEVIVKKAQLSFLDLFLKRLYDFGAKFKILDSETIKMLPSRNMKIDKIQSLPYPGIHSDIQPELGVLSTQTKGATLIHDPLFEGRLKYLEELNKMGADVIFCDPHRAIVHGPTELIGIDFPSPDLRAGAALITAGLIAKGKTVINNIYQIDRGYERIEERLSLLGADIKRVEDK